MPELPDITLYVEAIAARATGARLNRIKIQNPFLLRTVDPPPGALEGRTLPAVRRLGKRIVLDLGDSLFAVIHLMIAGRLHWNPKAAGASKALCAFEFSSGTLTLTEAGSKRRASLHLVQGEEALRALGRGGVEPLEVDLDRFREALRSVNHTLKRALTDPGIFSGIGNSYSDEILHRARLSPFLQTQKLSPTQIANLFAATQATLKEWTDRLREQANGAFPERVTAFRPEMAVHGRHGLPCPVCSTPVQRIVYAENESNYCPTCQTEGRLLADRALSRLLREDWPKSLDELERHTQQRRA